MSWEPILQVGKSPCPCKAPKWFFAKQNAFTCCKWWSQHVNPWTKTPYGNNNVKCGFVRLGLLWKQHETLICTVTGLKTFLFPFSGSWKGSYCKLTCMPVTMRVKCILRPSIPKWNFTLHSAWGVMRSLVATFMMKPTTSPIQIRQSLKKNTALSSKRPIFRCQRILQFGGFLMDLEIKKGHQFLLSLKTHQVDIMNTWFIPWYQQKYMFISNFCWRPSAITTT